MKSLLLLSILFVISCSKVTPLNQEIENTNLDDFRSAQSRYVKDQPTNIFLKEPWYVYDEANHIIWPVYKVYALKIDDTYYKFQIIDYYNNQNLPGNYTIRFQSEAGEGFIWKLNAQGCGNVYTNKNYAKCMRNPKTNVYTYLNLSTRKSSQLSSAQAKSSNKWHIAFNGTEIKLNAGIYGPGKVRLAHLYTYQKFFKGLEIDFQVLGQEAFSEKGRRFFDLDFDLRKARFFLPQGIDRVINEPDWFENSKTNQDLFVANTKNWWVVKGGEKNTFSKLRIKEISEALVNQDTVESNIKIEFYFQDEFSDSFELHSQTWDLPTFDNQTRVMKLCLDIDTKTIISCREKSWDLQLSALNRGLRRRWRINVNQGAIGPLSFEEMNLITDGRD